MALFDDVRAIALALPEVVETTSYGTPSFKVRRAMLARLHDDGERLVVRTTMEDQAALHAEDPVRYTVPDHYAGYPFVVVPLAAIDRAELRELLTDAWLLRAPATLRARHPDLG
ncbi:hypothetical protein CLV63_11895 [Murinocardiopsis flavida]|uniref:YjbR protein n=1 Tax=Murinocardiopsis flavida TaxID=645275 RepID=A0A2P8D537_9ACTN|nr:MmcQ/YjbR family DNA-binding protein [Murinocardiopsis flavida]PSK92336.1 hypothetical protein CLV63_11895 [Murinocardiopsis flavida]